MDWNMNYVIAVVGVVAVVGVILWLSLQRLGILLKSNNKQDAMKKSIERSWLHQLGGGGANKLELWIMTILATVAAIYKVLTVRPFDFLALLDTFVTASLVFVLANVVRLAVRVFQRKPSSPSTSQATVEERP